MKWELCRVRLSFFTCPNRENADKMAHLLVERQLAACVNILPNLTSVYAWHGNIETAQEILLIIKTSAEIYESLEALIRAHHPYELPEIIAIPVEKGLPEYINWIYSCCNDN